MDNIYFFELLNNREKVTLIWGLIFIVYVLSIKSARKALVELFRIILQPKMLVVIVLMIFYNMFIVFMFYKLSLWDLSLFKETCFWFVTSFILFVDVNDISKKEHYFEKVLLDSLKLAVILEFILNLYAFNFFVEMIIFPFVLISIIILEMIKYDNKLLPLKNFFLIVIAIYGVLVIYCTIRNISLDYKSFLNLHNVKSFFLPPVFTLIYIPFLYVLALVSEYELYFVRINNFLKEDKSLADYVKCRTLRLCNISLRKLKKFQKKRLINIMNAKDKKDIDELFFKLYKL